MGKALSGELSCPCDRSCYLFLDKVLRIILADLYFCALCLTPKILPKLSNREIMCFTADLQKHIRLSLLICGSFYLAKVALLLHLKMYGLTELYIRGGIW